MMNKKKNLLRVLRGEKPEHVPLWLMRQAGRYLPEYKALRAEAGSFMNLVLDPPRAATVTLQPVKRFGLDGAILFSDILIVPYGLGQHLEFHEGHGPVLEKIEAALPVFDAEKFFSKTKPIYETVQRVAEDMPDTATLIGFCGAPFTVACYLLGSSKDAFSAALAKAGSQPDFFARLLAVLTEASIFYLEKQIAAGAEAVQIFDSHSGLVAPHQFEDFILTPVKNIIAALKKNHPHLPIIAFPRGTGMERLAAYDAAVGADALSIDTATDMGWAARTLSSLLQGNLDPRLMEGEETPMRQAAEAILASMKKPFVFNLGHGLTPAARPENVERLARLVQGWQA